MLVESASSTTSPTKNPTHLSTILLALLNNPDASNIVAAYQHHQHHSTLDGSAICDACGMVTYIVVYRTTPATYPTEFAKNLLR